MSERFSYEKFYGNLPQFKGVDWSEPQAKLDAYYDLQEKHMDAYIAWYVTVWGPAKKRGEPIESPTLDEWVTSTARRAT